MQLLGLHGSKCAYLYSTISLQYIYHNWTNQSIISQFWNRRYPGDNWQQQFQRRQIYNQTVSINLVNRMMASFMHDTPEQL